MLNLPISHVCLTQGRIQDLAMGGGGGKILSVAHKTAVSLVGVSIYEGLISLHGIIMGYSCRMDNTNDIIELHGYYYFGMLQTRSVSKSMDEVLNGLTQNYSYEWRIKYFISRIIWRM